MARSGIPLTREELQTVVDAYYAHDCNKTHAARSLGIERTKFRKRFDRASALGMVGEFEGVVPDGMEINKVSKSFDKDGNEKGSSVHMGREKAHSDVPEGMRLKGLSRLTDASGNTTVQWEKYDETKPTTETVIEVISSAFDNLPKSPKLSGSVKSDKDLLALYPLADLHLGLLAWGKEVDQDWDTTIAVEKYKDCMERIAQGTENASEGIILGGGDLLHTDGYKPLTPQSGNFLDADTRWPKMLDAAVSLLVFQIDLARQKHDRVTVRILPGNHDETSAIAITYALSSWYRDDKRVRVDKDPSLFFWYRFGGSFIGATHGHAAKLTDMPLIMANRKPEDWAATKYRYVHGFHVHHKTQYAWENGGVIGETHQSPAVQDAYHFGKGYLSGRSMQSITYHKEYGEWARAPRVML